MKEYTIEQIKKALHLCGYYANGNCDKCPLNTEDCGNLLPRLAFHLIQDLEGANENEGN